MNIQGPTFPTTNKLPIPLLPGEHYDDPIEKRPLIKNIKTTNTHIRANKIS